MTEPQHSSQARPTWRKKLKKKWSKATDGERGSVFWVIDKTIDAFKVTLEAINDRMRDFNQALATNNNDEDDEAEIDNDRVTVQDLAARNRARDTEGRHRQ